jgi:hypothetical protein
VETTKVAVEFAADIFPVVMRIEPGFGLWQERRDDEIEAGAEVRPQIETYQIASVERPSLSAFGDRRGDMEDPWSRYTGKAVKVYFAGTLAKLRHYKQQLGTTAERVGWEIELGRAYFHNAICAA